MRYPDKPDGHAIEVRLYAEDPADDYQPQSGLLTAFEIPTSEHVRVDTGFESGNEVTTHYDAMLAKVVAYGRTRPVAARRLGDALSRARIHGVVTNRELLVVDPAGPGVPRRQGQHGVPRRWVRDRRSRAFLNRPRRPIAAAIALAEQSGATRAVQAGIPVAWRNVVSQPQRTEFHVSTGSTPRFHCRVVGRPGRLHRRRGHGGLGERHEVTLESTACGRRTT